MVSRYRADLAVLRAGLLALVAGLFARWYDPARPEDSLRLIGAVAGVLITRGQAAAAGFAVRLLGQLAPGEPFPIPPQIIGSAAGSVLADLSGMTPAVYVRRVQDGQSAEMGAQAAQTWLNSLAASEPYRAANAVMTRNALDDLRLTGRMVRATRPGACPFCRVIADRGYTPAAAGFAAHRNCQCTAIPEVRTA